MTPIVARCLLVGAAALLAGIGVLAPLAGSARATLIAAGAGCAVLDALVVRGVRTRAAAGDELEVVLPAPLPPAADDPSIWAAPSAPGTSAPDTAAPDTPEAARGDPARAEVVLGTTAGGRRVAVPAGADEWLAIVVVGTGALAVAVFRAVGAQVRDSPAVADTRATDTGTATTGATDTRTSTTGAAIATVVRVASAPDLRGSVGHAGAPCPPLPEGTAAVAVLSTDRSAMCSHQQDALRPRRTVVLVPGLTSMPRHWDVAIEVGRAGCAVRLPGDQRPTSVVPVLPLIGAAP